MDRDLMREYRVLSDLQHSPADREKAAGYLALRLEQYGLSVRVDAGLVSACLQSDAPGPKIAFGCAYDAQAGNDGAMVQSKGNDGLCAMLLTVMQRVFCRGGIQQGALCVQFHDSSVRYSEDDSAELLLTGRKTAEIAVRGTGELAEHCAEAVRKTMGKVTREDGPTAILLGAAASVNAETGALAYKRIALENGADILETLIMQTLCAE